MKDDKNFTKTVSYNLLYALVILGTILDVFGIACLGALTVKNAVGISSLGGETIHLFGLSSNSTTILFVITLVILFALYKLLFKARIFCRQYLEFDSNGVSSKFSSYDKLSRKEKDEIDKQKLMDTERILDSGTLRKMIHKGSLNPDKEMESLIGLQDVKREMHSMASRMAFEKEERKNKGARNLSMHMAFIGPPGTGKTTCARIMTGFLYKYGYIKNNMCIEVDGNFLKGTYPGETSKKTELIIRKALGGVLFIDEAYALLEEQGNGYGQEAIATIVKQMEDRRGDFILILAGYNNEMKTLINANPGFFSRIKYYLWFKSYSIDELGEIFNAMANQENFYVSQEGLEKFKKRMLIETNQKNFGNARSVRNCLEKAIDKHAMNVMDGLLKDEKKFMICDIDIDIKRKEADFFNN